MQKSKSDHSVFYKNSSSCIILLIVYVDDIVITGSKSPLFLGLHPKTLKKAFKDTLKFDLKREEEEDSKRFFFFHFSYVCCEKNSYKSR